MESALRNNENDVNGSHAVQAAVASGRDGHDRQVAPDHQQLQAVSIVMVSGWRLIEIRLLEQTEKSELVPGM